MEISNINRDALAQTYFIIKKLPIIEKKIPNNITENIYKYMNKDYIYEDTLMLESKQLLYAIMYKYVLNDTLKKNVNEYIQFYDKKIDLQKDLIMALVIYSKKILKMI